MLPRRHVSPVLLTSVVVIATAGLVYELIAGTVASYVLGDSVAQFSFVIGFYLFAMGIGAYLSRYIKHRLLERFVEIELGLALAGGISAPLLLVTYSSQGAFRFGLYSIVLIVGILVGLEIPLLIRLLRFQLGLEDLVARVLALDYLGALIASLIFPLVLLPRFGVHKTSLIFGLLNCAVAFTATFLIPIEHERRWKMRGECAGVGLALGLCLAFIDQTVLAAESEYFGAPVIYARQSSYQRIVITQTPKATRLFLNGNLQFSSDDEHRYHEALVHPAVAVLGHAPRRALILGGGDGLAARELLRYEELEAITLVDLDPAMIEVFRTVPPAVSLNRGSLSHEKVTVVNDDAYVHLAETAETYDLVIVDFPDPSNYAVGKLYTLSFYLRLRARLAEGGVAIVQATSPYYARTAFWSVVSTIEAADLFTLPLHAHVPSFGEWGYVICATRQLAAPSTLVDRGALRFLDDRVLAELFHFPPDLARIPAPINRINDQRLVSIYTSEWESWR